MAFGLGWHLPCECQLSLLDHWLLEDLGVTYKISDNIPVDTRDKNISTFTVKKTLIVTTVVTYVVTTRDSH